MAATDGLDQPWPDRLEAPDSARVQQHLSAFWETLERLPDLITRGEQLLAAEITHELRAIVLEMMLALNGIQRPTASRHLNSYLSASQRAAIERTLIAPAVDSDVNGDSWIGQAVALVVIQRWYAPQLVDRFDLIYPQHLEERVWKTLRANLPDWPAYVTSE